MNEVNPKPVEEETSMFSPKRRRRAAVAATAATILAITLSACSSGTESSNDGTTPVSDQTTGGATSDGASDGADGGNDTPARGGTLTFAAHQAPTSLDPALQSVDQVNNFYVNVAYDALTSIDGNGNVVPSLAESWEYSDDTNTTFLLHLRHGVKFSDGSDLTADAVAASLEYSHTKGVNGPNWLSSVDSITAVDDYTVQITTTEPNDSLPSVLSQRLLLGSIICPAGLKDLEGLKSATCGAGPYVLDTARTIPSDKYVYTPNPNYWDPSKIHWDEIVVMVVGNTTSALQAVQSGEADFMSGDATTGNAAQAAGLGVATAAFGLTGVNIMDRDGTVVPALQNAKVRQALLYAVDRDALSAAVFPGFSTPGFSLYAKGFEGFSDAVNDAYPYDIDKAKELMKEAGYEDGFTVEVSAATSNNTNILAQAVVEEWSKLGVKANLTTYTDLGQWTTDILDGKYPITFYNYGALPTYIVSKSFFTGGKTQFNAFDTTDPEISALLNTAASAPSPEAAAAGYEAVLQKAQVDDAWVSVTYTRDQIAIYNPKTVTGFTLSSQNPIPDIWSITPAS